MSQVEICSTFIGKVSVTTKQGVSETINFDDKGGIGFAKVSHEQAEQFLKIKGEYWKPGQRNIVDSVQTALNADPEAQKAANELLAGKTDTADKNVAQMVELIKLAETAEEVDALVGEDTRAGVATAAAKRKAQLEKE